MGELKEIVGKGLYYPLFDEDCVRILTASMIAVVKWPLTREKIEAWIRVAGQMEAQGIDARTARHILDRARGER